MGDRYTALTASREDQFEDGSPLSMWKVPDDLFDPLPKPVVDQPGEWSCLFTEQMLADDNVRIGTPIGLDTYNGDPRPLGKVVRIAPHEWGFMVTIDCEKPWEHWSLSPMFFEWVVL